MAHVWHEQEPELPRPTWWRFAQRLAGETERDHILVLGASVAYFSFIVLFPTLIALVSLVGLVADSHVVHERLRDVAHLMSPAVYELLSGQLQQIARTAPASLWLGLAMSAVGSLWAASSGAQSFVKALNIVYGSSEARSFLRVRAVTMLVVLGGVVAVVSLAAVIFGMPLLVSRLGASSWLSEYLGWVRWGVGGVLASLALACVYRFAPCRPQPRWRWIAWGSLAGTLLWLGATALLVLGVSFAGTLQELYGALVSVLLLLLWMHLSAVAVLTGAEVDATVEWVDRGFRPADPDLSDEGWGVSGPRQAQGIDPARPARGRHASEPA